MTSSPLSRRTVLAAGVAASLPSFLSNPANADPVPEWQDVTPSFGLGVTWVGTPAFIGPHDGWAPATANGHPWGALLRWRDGNWPLDGLPSTAYATRDSSLTIADLEEMWLTTYGAPQATFFYDGSDWRAAEPPEVYPGSAKELFPRSLSAGRDGTAWLVIADGLSSKSAVFDWEEDAWVPVAVPLPQGAVATRVGVRSDQDVWVAGTQRVADGSTPAGAPLTLHWDGRRWRRVQIPPVASGTPQGITTVLPVSKKLAWAYRSNPDVVQNHTLLRWTGGETWEEFFVPQVNFPTPALAEDGQGGVWLGGYGRDFTRYVHFREGTWTFHQGPVRKGPYDIVEPNVSGLVRIPETQTILATGLVVSRSSQSPHQFDLQPFMERLN
ncbi:hypothetical protein [Actinomadura roseirufa]|uniref:hypothetical protein n=1 Tax=Actinomadura roseirufa TaxID=2094049 RepID=UPI001041AD3F|nr:hypothetical protein [Actinomadura roseirufa]